MPIEPVVIARKITPTILLCVGMVLAAALLGAIRYGSIKASIAALRSEPLIVDDAKKSFGTMKARQTVRVDFEIQNMGDQPIELAGCRTTCDCVATSEFPTSIQPHEQKRLHFNITPAQASANYAVGITVFTDVPTQPDVVLSIVGTVVEP